MSQNSVLYDDFYNRVEYLIFAVFYFPSHSVGPMKTFLFTYILTFLVSDKPVPDHKFENKILRKKKILWNYQKNIFETFLKWVLAKSIVLVKSLLPKDSLVEIAKYENNFFSNTCDLRKLHYFYNWGHRIRHISYFQVSEAAIGGVL